MKLANLCAFSLLLGPCNFLEATCYVTAYVVTPPDHRRVQVLFECFDADNPSSRLGVITKEVRGHLYIQGAISPADTTKHVIIKIGPEIPGYEIIPPDIKLDRNQKTPPDQDETLNIRDVTWVKTQKDRDDVYIQSIRRAERSRNPEEVVQNAAYAGAVANTANQKIEAARIEASAISRRDPTEALTAFSRAADAPNFDKADDKKKKAFVAEWFDTIETAAKSEGATPDKQTGLILSSVPQGSEVPKQLDKLTETLANVEPNFSSAAEKKITAQTKKLGSETAAKENVIRGRFSRGPFKIKF